MLDSIVTRATGLRWTGCVSKGVQVLQYLEWVAHFTQPRYDGVLFQVVPFTSGHLD